ncbi:hypothetical protein K488DRAFT_89816 [Vararia minispora EC-137]|uniref:Uncharacterized protein n=1 Tax=Vararia minispora EC-137 TaxID=1314806 RepID=A0ACB8Q974_9AGAM|nr:hypothetical protein K488DRAFT_89816 [Vararia minispora EC-137]
MSSPIDIRLTFGQILIGAMLGSVFYGTVLLQAGLYFGSKKSDDLRNNILVTILVVLETFAWVLEVYCVWWYFVLNYANPDALGTLNWSLTLDPFITYTIVLIGQMFFIEKIWILGRSTLLGILLAFLALSGWGAGIAIGILNFIQKTTNSTPINDINYYEKASETLVELLIAICMLYLLRRMRSGIKRSDQILNNLIIFMLTRGVVVCVIQIVYTGTSFTTTNLVWITPHFCIGKFATNAVLASLNVRELVKVGWGRPRFSGFPTDSDVVVSTGPSSEPRPVTLEPLEFGHMRSDISARSGVERDESSNDDGKEGKDFAVYSVRSLDRVQSIGHHGRSRGTVTEKPEDAQHDPETYVV